MQNILMDGGDALERREQRNTVAEQSSSLAARQLEHVGIALLRHQARAGAEIVGQRDESKFAARVGDELRTETRQVRADEREREQDVGDEVTIAGRIERVGGDRPEAKRLFQ